MDPQPESVDNGIEVEGGSPCLKAAGVGFGAGVPPFPALELAPAPPSIVA